MGERGLTHGHGSTTLRAHMAWLNYELLDVKTLNCELLDAQWLNHELLDAERLNYEPLNSK